MDTLRFAGFFSKSLILFSAFCGAAFAGSVSREIDRLPQDRPVAMIVQYAGEGRPSVSWSAYRASVISHLPNGELCMITPAAAVELSKTSSIAHISVNHTIRATGSALPVYDYLPQSLRTAPGSFARAASPNLSLGNNIGVAVIDS